MATRTFIDGTEVTSVCQGGTSTHRLNKKYLATCKIPVIDAVDGIGKLLRVEDADLANPIDFHGYIKHESADDGPDGDGMVEYSAESIRELWEWRPARDPDGDLSKPTFLEDNSNGPAIMQAILDASENAGSGPPLDAEGPLLIVFGTFPGGGVDLSGAPVDWPMMIEEIASLLCDTGELDIVETMINSGGNLSQIDCYNGNFGTDRSGSVDFQYEAGGNVTGMKRVRDMSKLCNKLFYYLGPKCDDQHWRRNVQYDDPGLPDPFPNGMSKADFTTQRTASRNAYMVRFDQRIYDEAGAGVCDSGQAYDVPLHWRLWETESLLRVNPRVLVHATPAEGIKPAFDIGDLIGVGADTFFMGGFDGVQRVYERKISWDQDGVVQLAEIVSSDDQEG